MVSDSESYCLTLVTLKIALRFGRFQTLPSPPSLTIPRLPIMGLALAYVIAYVTMNRPFPSSEFHNQYTDPRVTPNVDTERTSCHRVTAGCCCSCTQGQDVTAAVDCGDYFAGFWIVPGFWSDGLR
jgi:hypothetical protein